MTEKEHTLMVFMFTKQMTVITSLIEIMKSRQVLTDDDLIPFQKLVLTQEQASHEILNSVISQYTEYATTLGLQQSLPQPKNVSTGLKGSHFHRFGGSQKSPGLVPADTAA